MPQQFLQAPVVYCVVGLYRLIHDPLLRIPVWNACRKSLLTYGAPLSAFACLVSWPFTSLYVSWMLSRSGPIVSIRGSEARWWGLSTRSYTIIVLLLDQASIILRLLLRRQLGKARKHAYQQTIASRGKDMTFWKPYVEEWERPPVEQARRAPKKLSFYDKLSNPITRFLILRILIAPLDFVPFLGIAIVAGIQSLTMCRSLLAPYFAAKRMSSEQIELFLAERKIETRSFGFVAAFLEKLPLIGLVFSVSNRVGIAMWAHDLEKRQHAFAEGTLKKTKKYIPKESSPNNPIAKAQREVDIPDTAVGAFPVPHKNDVSSSMDDHLFEDQGGVI